MAESAATATLRSVLERHARRLRAAPAATSAVASNKEEEEVAAAEEYDVSPQISQEEAAQDVAMLQRLSNFGWVLAAAVALSFFSFMCYLLAASHHLHELVAFEPLVASGALVSAVVAPLTYLVGGQRQHGWRFCRPCTGGGGFIVLASVGWVFYFAAIALPAVVWYFAVRFPAKAWRWALIAAGVSGLTSEIVMVSSLLSYSHKADDLCPRPRRCGQDEDADEDLAMRVASPAVAPSRALLTSSRGFRVFLRSRRGHVWWGRFVGGNIALSVVALAGAATLARVRHDGRLEGGADSWLFVAALFFVFSTLTIAVCLTHGIGGKWRHFYDAWRFVQPAQGGPLFVVLQGLSWSCFGLAVLIFLAHLLLAARQISASNASFPGAAGKRQTVAEMGAMVPVPAMLAPLLDAPPSLVTGGVLGVVAELLLASSLLVFQGRSSSESKGKTASKSAAKKGSAAPGKDVKKSTADATLTRRGSSPGVSLGRMVRSAWRSIIVAVNYNIHLMMLLIIFLSMHTASFTMPWFTISCWLIGYVLYVPTYFAAPNSTGCRHRPGLLRGNFMVKAAVEYFSLDVVRSSAATASPPLPPNTSADKDKARRYVFGYHPHGILPLTMGWICHTDAWEKVLPGIEPAPLASSILHQIPILRDYMHWAGGFEVTRTGFLTALKKRGAVMVIPGGQKEMIYSTSSSNVKQLVSSHKGFVRMALQTAASLVPVYSFGESQTLDNYGSFLGIKMQRRSMQILRANIFFFPFGVWYLPIPRSVPITIAVGEPIAVPQLIAPPRLKKAATTTSTQGRRRGTKTKTEKDTEDEDDAEVRNRGSPLCMPRDLYDMVLDILHARYFTALRDTFDTHKATSASRLGTSHAAETLEFVPPIRASISAAEWQDVHGAILAWQKSQPGRRDDKGVPLPDPDPFENLTHRTLGSIETTWATAFFFVCLTTCGINSGLWFAPVFAGATVIFYYWRLEVPFLKKELMV